MNIKDPSTKMLYSTTSIEVNRSDGKTMRGTGFFYDLQLDDASRVSFLITNHHVVDKLVKAQFELHFDRGGTPSREVMHAVLNPSHVEGSRLGNLDLVAIPIAGFFNEAAQIGKPVFYCPLTDEIVPNVETVKNLAALEEIVFVGCPNGIYDCFNNVPLIRRGFTASPIWNDFEGRPEFLIDASVFPGSSGSPVFLFNQGSFPVTDGIAVGTRLLFVGVVTKTVTRGDGAECIDLGNVIKSSAMRKELGLMAERWR